MGYSFCVDKGSITTKTDYDRLLALVREGGMDYKWAAMFVKKLIDDENEYLVDDQTKEWALKRGFYPGRVEMYGLTDENYENYMPDYSYFMIHPLNHHFKKWLDKLTLKYVLNSNQCEDCMPEYYLYVENNGNYTYLMDLPDTVKKDRDFILNLLKEKGVLAIKPNSGTSGGKGFMKVEWTGNGIRINNREEGLEGFHQIISNLGNNIVTEYCRQHSALAKIWPDSECTLRLIMMKMPYQNIWDDAHWECIVSIARFGASVSGGASNMSSGGIGVGFDYETGKCHDFGLRYRRFCPDGNIYCYEHPDTHVAWRDLTLPNWPIVKEKIKQVCQQISSLDYLGLDVIITEKGMKICEINSHPGIDEDQILCDPVLTGEKARAFFRYHGLYSVDNNDFYEMYWQCRIKVD
ncbi:MAG: sugar-transfer associated ATP-grasp domain-containing protein [Clostridia bacterium]|nr:sugar-transfer associated ATP-grasp domain-containing protein [Clostridia bacterium]